MSLLLAMPTTIVIDNQIVVEQEAVASAVIAGSGTQVVEEQLAVVTRD